MFEFLLQKLLYILALSSPLCRSPSEVPERLPPEPKPQKVCWIKHNSQLLGCGFFVFFPLRLTEVKMKPETWFSKWTRYVIISIYSSLLETVQLLMSGCTDTLLFFTSFCLCLGSLEPQGGPVLICAVMVQWHHLSATIPSVSPPDFLWLHWVAWILNIAAMNIGVHIFSN